MIVRSPLRDISRWLAAFCAVLLVSPAACSQTVGPAPQHVKDSYLADGVGVAVESWVRNLEIPWSLVFLGVDRALVSERPGRIRLIRDGSLEAMPWAEPDVGAQGEGGLMGLAVHPDFPEKPFVYTMLTYRAGNVWDNRVVRYRDDGERGLLDQVILKGIPAARFHNGGRIAFGPDGMLYVTTGENYESTRAQDTNSLAGKILRITPEGGIPNDNPFPGSPVYSFGHRNPQGLAWAPGTGDLFASEHGPSGEYGRFAHDEINVIRKGGNYGWPTVIGAPGEKGLVDPLVVWKDTTPPSGIAFSSGDLLSEFAGDLFVASLGAECLIRISLGRHGQAYDVKGIERWFTTAGDDSKFGRIRDVTVGPDGALYILSNNTDGRGTPRPGDDHIYRIVPSR